MTTPTTVKPELSERPKRRHRAPNGPGLYVTDRELIEILGIPPATAKPVLAMLDRDRSKGFPPKQKLWGDRRYWPAVEDWLNKTNGLVPQQKQRSA